MVPKRLSIQGFVVLDHLKDWLSGFYAIVPKNIVNGEMKHCEQVYHGLKEAEHATLDVQKGNNKAKAVIVWLTIENEVDRFLVLQ